MKSPACEVSITGKVTVSDGQRHAVDPLASQRAELLGKLAGAQIALEKVIAQLAQNGASTALADSQLSRLASLQATIGSADAASLSTLRGEIASAVAESKAVAEQARDDTNSANAAASASLMAARSHARETITRMEEDLYGKKIFDPYLRFQSEQDERAFREREEANRRAVASARAKGTPEGEAEALAIEHRQLLDMGAHGATDSPDFAERLKATTEAYEQQRAAMRQTGHDAKQADAMIAADTRDFLKAKGVPEAQITVAMQSGKPPSEIIAPYVGKPQVERLASPESKGNSDQAQTAPDHLDAVAAALRAAGVVTTANTAVDGHGVDVAVASSAAGMQRA